MVVAKTCAKTTRSHELVESATLEIDGDNVGGIEPVLECEHRSYTVKLHRTWWWDRQVVVEREVALL